MRVLIYSRVRKALSSTSGEETEVVSRGIGQRQLLLSVATGIQKSLHRYRTVGAVQCSQRLLDAT